MKIDSSAWAQVRQQAIFYLWPSLISSVAMFFVLPWALETSPKWSLLMPLLGLLIFVPFVLVDVRLQRAATALKERELQAKYDAEDKAIFGKPLSELEI